MKPTIRTTGRSELLSETEVLTTGVVAAPRERVFAAWTTADQLSRWWGPTGFTNTFETFEPVAGGAWRFVMHGPDGKAYRNVSEFIEVSPPQRLVLRHASGPFYLATFTFETEGEQSTMIRWHMRFENARFLAGASALILESNLQNLERLEAVLEAG